MPGKLEAGAMAVGIGDQRVQRDSDPPGAGPDLGDIGALVVTYHPDPGLESRLETLLGQVARILIVDNASSPQEQSELNRWAEAHPAVDLVSNRQNLGIAGACNQGMQWMLERGLRWCLTLDQDSRVEKDMVARLAATARAEQARGPIALVAPNVVDEGMPPGSRRWLLLGKTRLGLGFRRTGCDQPILEDVVAISSGCLVCLDVWRAIGGFDEGLFIDYVDTDYCLRAVRGGYRTLVDCRARLHHRVGAKERRKWLFLTLTPTFHSPLRRYYLCRNRIHMLRRHALAWPHWLSYELVATVHTTAAVLLLEPARLQQLHACILGTWDGLRRRRGAAARRLRGGD